MDNLDRALLKLLQQNGLESAKALSSHLHVGQRTIQRRMKNMREIVAGNNIYRWGASIVSRLISIAGG